MENIIKATRELGKTLQESEIYKKFHTAKAKNDSDEELQEMIGKFNMIKVEIDTMLAKDGNESDKVKEKNLELRKVYADIMKNEAMAEYNAASQEMTSMMNAVNTILQKAANGEDPATCDIHDSCGGECGGCSGCS